MRLELLVRAISRPILKLISMNLEGKGFSVLGRGYSILLLHWGDADAKHSPLLWHSFYLVFRGNNFKDEARIFDHNPLYANATRTTTARHFHLSTMEVGSA